MNELLDEFTDCTELDENESDADTSLNDVDDIDHDLEEIYVTVTKSKNEKRISVSFI